MGVPTDPVRRLALAVRDAELLSGLTRERDLLVNRRRRLWVVTREAHDVFLLHARRLIPAPSLAFPGAQCREVRERRSPHLPVKTTSVRPKRRLRSGWGPRHQATPSARALGRPSALPADSSRANPIRPAPPVRLPASTRGPAVRVGDCPAARWPVTTPTARYRHGAYAPVCRRRSGWTGCLTRSGS